MEGISPPGHLDLRAEDLAGEWRRWVRSFNDYLLAIDLVANTKAAEKRKLALFRHVGGEDVREVYSQMEFRTEPDEHDNTTEIEEGAAGRKLTEVIEKFHQYCNPRSGIVVSRFQFHNISQDSETVDVFLMKLRRLAEGCQFGTQRDSLIRDKLLFGLDDTKERDRLMRESDEKLSLDFVIRSLRVAEKSGKLKSSKPTELKPEEVGAVNSDSGKRGRVTKGYNGGYRDRQQRPKCDNCGKNHLMGQRCPAVGTTCNKCGKQNHWAMMCKSTSRNVNEVTEIDEADVYLGEISPIESVDSRSWYTTLKVNTSKWKGQKIRFKLDTGAALSICGPNHFTGEIKPTQKRLYGPGYTLLTCLGVMTCQMRTTGEVIEEDVYIIQNQKTPLLSRSACERLKLIKVDDSQCQIGNVNVDSQLFEGLGKLDTEYSITLKDDARPYAIHVPRPIPFPRREMADEALHQMIQDGVIVKEDGPTPWVAPMVVVPKPGQSKVRICTDYTELNKYILREIHPMSTVDSSLALLGRGVIFSKIDANSGFWQIPLSKKSSKLTTFLTHSGRFRYLRLPQGLCSSPEIFTAEMNRILEGVEGVIIHMDDVLVFGENKDQHDSRLKIVLDKLNEAGMILNRNKCKFGVSSVEFLGHIIDSSGIHAGPRIQGIIDFPIPKNVSAIRSFLGMANQYAKFSPELADATQSLRLLLRKDTPWHWSHDQEKSFHKVKTIFENTPVLAVYDVNLETIVTTDASKVGVGATLSQIQTDGSRRLVAAASRSLTETEQRYAAIEKEGLGVCWAMEKFSQYILGMKSVTIETDHRPLVTLFGNMFLDRLPPRLQGFKLRLQRYQYTIRHVKGSSNVSADALSRYSTAGPTDSDEARVEEIEKHVDYLVTPQGSDVRLERVRIEQKEDEILSRVIKYIENEWPSYLSSEDTLMKPYYDRKGLLTMNKGFLMLGNRLVMPLSQRDQVLQDLHRGHLGISKCQSRARNSVWWPSMSKAIEAMVASCRECKLHANKTIEPLRPTATPDRPWQILGTDLLQFKGQTYLLVIDYYSRYPELALLGNSDFSSRKVILHLKSMFSRHGIPQMVLSDNGPQYACGEFASFAAEYGFSHVTSSPHYHRANGAAERGVQTIKNMLKKESDPYLALLAYRTSPQFGLYSPAELLMGRKLRTTVVTHPDELMPRLPDHDRFKSVNDQYKARMKTNHDQNNKVKPLPLVSSGDDVWVRGNQRHGTAQTSSEEMSRKMVVNTEKGDLVRNRSDVVLLPQRSSGRASKQPTYLADYDCAEIGNQRL